jgi:hypothetical protein
MADIDLKHGFEFYKENYEMHEGDQYSKATNKTAAIVVDNVEHNKADIEQNKEDINVLQDDDSVIFNKGKTAKDGDVWTATADGAAFIPAAGGSDVEIVADATSGALVAARTSDGKTAEAIQLNSDTDTKNVLSTKGIKLQTEKGEVLNQAASLTGSISTVDKTGVYVFEGSGGITNLENPGYISFETNSGVNTFSILDAQGGTNAKNVIVSLGAAIGGPYLNIQGGTRNNGDQVNSVYIQRYNNTKGEFEFGEVSIDADLKSELLPDLMTPINGFKLSRVKSGNQYSYFANGSFTATTTWSSGTTIALGSVTEFPELANYVGDPSYQLARVVSSTESTLYGNLLFKFDNTGISIKVVDAPTIISGSKVVMNIVLNL